MYGTVQAINTLYDTALPNICQGDRTAARDCHTMGKNIKQNFKCMKIKDGYLALVWSVFTKCKFKLKVNLVIIMLYQTKQQHPSST